MQDFFNRLREQFLKLKKEQRYFLMAILFIVFIIFVMLVVWATRIEWVPLFNNSLNPKEAGKIVAKLKELPYKYKIDNNGATILVPIQDKAKILLELANNDSLPESSEGFKEVFKESGLLGETRERERINYIRGLQGELERTISEIQQIEKVRVHIVLPKKTLFEEDQEEPTASVYLKLKPYETLKIEQIKGIQNLIAYAIEGLKPKNVKIIDMFGRILSDKVLYEDEEGGKTTLAIKLQKQYERDLERKTQSMLERVLGPGRAVVRVVCELNFDKIETMSKEFAPPIKGEDTGLKRSEEIEKEQYKGIGVVPGGVPGVDTNIPGYKGVNEEKNEYNRVRNINNYELNTIEKKIIRAPGAIKRLSISVIIDGKLNEEEKKALESNVKTAVGYVEGRDSIQFTQIAFSKAERDAALKAWEEAQRRRLLITVSILIGLVFLTIGIFVFIWGKKRREELRRIEEEAEEEIIEIDDEVEEPLSIEEQERREMEERIREIARKDPAKIASLIRIWMIEE